MLCLKALGSFSNKGKTRESRSLCLQIGSKVVPPSEPTSEFLKRSVPIRGESPGRREKSSRIVAIFLSSRAGFIDGRQSDSNPRDMIINL